MTADEALVNSNRHNDGLKLLAADFQKDSNFDKLRQSEHRDATESEPQEISQSGAWGFAREPSFLGADGNKAMIAA